MVTKTSGEKGSLADIIVKNETALLNQWVQEQLANVNIRRIVKESELREQAFHFLQLLGKAVATGTNNIQSPEWEPVRKLLESISRARGEAGFSSVETATFIFSFKKTLFSFLRQNEDVDALAEDVWAATELLDKLGLYTVEIFQKTREDIIANHQQDMLELSTPVVSLADGILALPLIGTLDSSRTQIVMETLLQRIVETGSTIAIIDITGVPTVDTLVAQHLLKTITAARLMGADCIISGIRPQIAQTIVHLGVELGDVITKSTLASAFKTALDRNNMAIVKIKAPEKK
jgi:rsbT co-antagonist protein RsbR